MFSNLINNKSIPLEQSKWLLKFVPILKLAQNYHDEHIDYMLDEIEKEALDKGYTEILDLI